MKELYHPQSASGAMAQTSSFARDVLMGLLGRPKFLSSRWLYDSRGSALFERIMELPEYYPTRCEAEILERSHRRIAGVMPGPFRLVELGAGDGRKTKILLRHFLRAGLEFKFVPVDICAESVRRLARSLARELPSLSVEGLVAEYFAALLWLGQQADLPTLVLFLGSNIGNFDHEGDERFLRQLKMALKPQDVALVGFDLLKDEALLVPAYQDSAGITTEFNLNLLARMNRELGANFERSTFRHEARFNRVHSRMESWLVSTVQQTVNIPKTGRSFVFRKEEGIHVECSVKYTAEQIAQLAGQAGFSLEDTLLDKKGWFCDAILCRR